MSILAQTRKPDEIVINDDCSSDGTEEIIREVSQLTAVPIRFEKNKQQLGFAKNFRCAVNRTKGDIIFLSDQDDIWLPYKIELCMSVLEKREDVLALSTDFFLFFSRPTARTPMPINNIKYAAAVNPAI